MMFWKSVQRGALLTVCGGVLMALPMCAQESAPPPTTTQSPTDGQNPPPPPPPQRGGPGMRGMDVNRRVQMLQTRLSLTPDQTTRVKTILVDEQNKMEAMRNDPSMQGPGRRDAMARLRGTTDGKINEVLNPDQQKQYAALQDEMRRHQEQRREGGYPPPPPPPAGAPQM